MESRQQAEEIVRTVLLDAGCDFMAEDSVKFVAAKIDAKDATITRLEAEVENLKRAMNIRHKDTMKWVDLHTKLEAENAALRERAEQEYWAMRGALAKIAHETLATVGLNDAEKVAAFKKLAVAALENEQGRHHERGS